MTLLKKRAIAVPEALSLHSLYRRKFVDLTTIPTRDLLGALLYRTDIIDERGMTVHPAGYQLLTSMNTLPCTDIVGVRLNKGIVEGCLTIREAGYYSGHFTMIGGRVPYGMHFEDSLRNHIREDLGVEIQILSGINRPDYVWPYTRIHARNSKYWGHDPSKFAIGLTYLATFDWTVVSFREKSHSGPEARALHWFSLNTLPTEEKFGYGHYTPFTECLNKAATVPEILLRLPCV